MPVSLDAVNAALATVSDPEIHRPITDLGMVKSVSA
ncbi:MAG: iron-sulfur cluster assembly protein, partial [Actinomycetota bacterium]|nr:iron-sulfur cluster assembly protein [Actinomycetota bacterium]